jgi:hypothetical protein
MSRGTNVLVNFVLNGLLLYVIGRKLRGHRTGLGLGLAFGALSGLVTWVLDSRAAADESVAAEDG